MLSGIFIQRAAVGAAATLFLTMVASRAEADPCEGALPRQGATFEGTVYYVGDGDSLCIGQSPTPSTWVEVRVADFYAPELHAPGGEAAKAALTRLAKGKLAHCLAGRRSYDRVVASCTINGSSIGDLMRRARVAEGGNGR